MPHVNSADRTAIGYDRLGDDRPALVLVGGGLSAGLPVDFFGAAADAAAALLPDAQRLTIEVAGHVADPALLAPRLAEFYRG